MLNQVGTDKLFDKMNLVFLTIFSFLFKMDTVAYRVDEFVYEKKSYNSYFCYMIIENGYEIQHVYGGSYTTFFIYPDKSFFYISQEFSINSPNISLLNDSIKDLVRQDRNMNISANNELGYNYYKIRPEFFKVSDQSQILIDPFNKDTRINDTLFWSEIRYNELRYGYCNVPKSKLEEFEKSLSSVFYNDKFIIKNENSVDSIVRIQCQIEEIFKQNDDSCYYIYARSMIDDNKIIIVSPIEFSQKCNQNYSNIKVGECYQFELMFHDKIDFYNFSPPGMISIGNLNLKLKYNNNFEVKMPNSLKYGRIASSINLKKGIYYEESK